MLARLVRRWLVLVIGREVRYLEVRSILGFRAILTVAVLLSGGNRSTSWSCIRLVIAHAITEDLSVALLAATVKPILQLVYSATIWVQVRHTHMFVEVVVAISLIGSRVI